MRSGMKKFILCLTYKLIQLGIHLRLIHLIYSYLSNRSFCVRINNILWNLYVFSGDNLQGPILLNIFFNDMSHTLRNFITLYADNTAIYSSAHHPFYLYKNFQNI